MKTPALFCLTVILAFTTSALWSHAQPNEAKPSMEELIERLEDRIEELEKHFAPLLEDEERLETIDVQRYRAEQRALQDRDHYTQDQLKHIEELYRTATNKDTSPTKSKTLLKEIGKKYPKSNRAGCALQYLGQRATGEKQIQYFEDAIKNHSDCYYGNGVQVGPYARYHLASAYLQAGDISQAKALFEIVVQKYPDAITHRGQLLAPFAQSRLDRIAQREAAAKKPN